MKDGHYLTAVRALGVLALRRDNPSDLWTEDHARQWLDIVWGIQGWLADECIAAGNLPPMNTPDLEVTIVTDEQAEKMADVADAISALAARMRKA